MTSNFVLLEARSTSSTPDGVAYARYRVRVITKTTQGWWGTTAGMEAAGAGMILWPFTAWRELADRHQCPRCHYASDTETVCPSACCNGEPMLPAPHAELDEEIFTAESWQNQVDAEKELERRQAGERRRNNRRG